METITIKIELAKSESVLWEIPKPINDIFAEAGWKVFLYVELNENYQVTNCSFVKIDGASLFLYYGQIIGGVHLFKQAWRFLTGLDSLYEKLQDYIDFKSYNFLFDTATKKLDLRDSNCFEENGFRQVRVVNERLNLCRHLIEVKRQAPDHIKKQYDPLCMYLLLTCFDILGSKKGWVQFNVWLESYNSNSKKEKIVKRKDEVNNALRKADSNLMNAAILLQEAYSNIYGVSTSFYNFIDKLLLEEDKVSMLDVIGKREEAKNNNNINEKEEKAKFLYQIRNSYTHQGALYFNDFKLFEEQLITYGFTKPRDKINKSDKYYFTVSHPSQKLYEVVCKGLIEYIKRL